MSSWTSFYLSDVTPFLW